MVVPAAVEELDEAHVALGHPAGEQAVAGERAALVHLRPVQVEDVLRLAGEVGQFGHRGLHAEGHFLLGDRGLNLGVADLVEVLSVQLGSPGRASCGGPRGSTPAGFDRNRTGSPDGWKATPWCLEGRKPDPPEAAVERLHVAGAAGPERRGEHHEVGQVLVHPPSP